MDSGDKPKVNWLNLDSGKSATVRFVNELDEDSPSYDESRGLALVVYEHTNPNDYRKRAVCSMDTEGRCWACDMSQRHRGKWYRVPRFYISMLFDDGVNEPKVVVWSMGVRRSQTFALIREYAIETGSVTNLKWRLRRQGEKTDTTWTLIPSAPDAIPFDWDKALTNSAGESMAVNLDAVPYEVPFSEQEAFYLGSGKKPQEDDEEKVVSSNVPW